MNQHLDLYCLKGLKDPERYEITASSRIPADSSQPSENPRLPKVAYSLVKDNEFT